PRVDVRQLREAPEEEARAGDEDETEGDLRRDEGSARPVRPRRSRVGRAQSAVDRAPRTVPGRREPERDARYGREGEAEEQHGRVDPFGGARKGPGEGARGRLKDPGRAERSHRGPAECENEALREEQSDQPGPARAQGHPDADLPAAAVGAGEEQI